VTPKIKKWFLENYKWAVGTTIALIELLK